MKIDIQLLLLGKHADKFVTEELEKKLCKLELEYQEILDGKICFREDLSNPLKNKVADIYVRMPNKAIYVEGRRSQNLKGAFDAAIKELKKKLISWQ